MIEHLKEEDFQKKVVDSSLPVVIDFMADWCQPCRQLAPVLDEVSTQLTERVQFFKLNIDENPNIPNMLGIRSIPTLILYKNGKIISTQQGAMSKQKMLDWLQDV